jgi:hypothetical protein
LQPAVTISKNGGVFNSPAGAVSDIGNGWYVLAANATDRDTLGSLVVHAEAVGADPSDDVLMEIVNHDPYNDLYSVHANYARRAGDYSVPGDLMSLIADYDAAKTAAPAAALATLGEDVGAISHDYARRTGDYAMPGDQMDLIETVNPSALASLTSGVTAAVQSIWTAAVAGMTTPGSIGKWIIDHLDATISVLRLAYATSSAQPDSAMAISRNRGDDWLVHITDLGSLVGYSKLWLTMKKLPPDNSEVVDADSILQVILTPNGVGSGLVVLNGAVGTANQAFLAILDIDAGNIDFSTLAVATCQINPDVYAYDVQVLFDTKPITRGTGAFTVTRDVTRSIS